jgi:hypothetical protein
MGKTTETASKRRRRIRTFPQKYFCPESGTLSGTVVAVAM